MTGDAPAAPAPAPPSAARPLRELKFGEILRLNRELGERVEGPALEVAVLSNVVTAQLGPVLEYALRSERVPARVVQGDYDNLPQESGRLAGADVVVVFWEAANLVDGFEYRANTMDEAAVQALEERVKGEMELVLRNLAGTRLVLFNRFSSLAFTHASLRPDRFEQTCRELNRFLEEAAPGNVVLVDVEKVMARLSVERSVDFRYFYSSRALYSVDFYKEYAAFVRPAVLAPLGRAKKALVLDCDNTLWRGILGEDGPEGIAMAPDQPHGRVFEHVQHLALALSRRGVIVGLCSKNNPADVDEVLARHPHMCLRDGDLAVKRVNWSEKAWNLEAIARDLNVGVDSLVFLDDSPFEVGCVRERLPEVTALQVPEQLHQYPQFLRERLDLFFSLSRTHEDGTRVRAYREQAERAAERQRFDSLEAYLQSLDITIRVHANAPELVPRSAQLTQKTNQFNLTTRRYTEPDLARFTAQPGYDAFAIGVSDRFGDYGITGLCIVRKDGAAAQAEIDTLLLSCRVIGRGIELALVDHVLRRLRAEGIERVAARYVPTAKNAQVAGLYDRFGFVPTGEEDGETRYLLRLCEYQDLNVPHVHVIS